MERLKNENTNTTELPFVISGEGDFCIDFLIPLIRRDLKYIAIYNNDLSNDYVEKTKIESFLNGFLKQKVAEFNPKEYWHKFYGISEEDWPFHVPDMLRIIYRSIDLDIEVKERHPGSNLSKSFLSYINYLKNISINEWYKNLNSESSRIVLKTASEEPSYVESLSFNKDKLTMLVDNDPYNFNIFPEIEKFTGERSIIHQFEFGTPGFVPWYVRESCKDCDGSCSIKVPNLMEPIYSKHFDTRKVLTKTELDLPWGLLWDVFDFSKLKGKDPLGYELKHIFSKLKPTKIESLVLRCAKRESISFTKRRAAALSMIEGISQFYARELSSSDFVKSFEESIKVSSHLSQDFKFRLWLIVFFRFLRRLIFTNDKNGLEYLLRNNLVELKEKCSMFIDVVRMKRLNSFLNWLNSSFQKEASMYAIQNRFALSPKPTGDIEKLLTGESVNEVISIWNGLEDIFRINPYKVFALLPYFELNLNLDNHNGNIKTKYLCLKCCRISKKNTNETM